jgi:hypothetical protein
MEQLRMLTREHDQCRDLFQPGVTADGVGLESEGQGWHGGKPKRCGSRRRARLHLLVADRSVDLPAVRVELIL